MNISVYKNGASTSNSFSTNQNYYDSLDYSKIKASSNGSNILKEINIQNKMNQNLLKNDEETDNDENDVTLEEKMLNDVECLLYNNNNGIINNNDHNQESDKCINRSNSHSLPQLPIYSYPNCYASKTMSEHEQNSSNDLISKFSEKTDHYFSNSNSKEKYSSNESIKSMQSISSTYSDQNKNKKENKENQKRKIVGLFNDFKLNPFNFHSLETFGRFIRYSLNLKSEVVKEIISNPRIQYWIDKNKCHGFVYQTYPRIDETKRRVPQVRCELCKFYGHLSHTCSIKELAFKLNNIVLKNGACRCHICGQLGHPAEAGLCPYIACSFCNQNGHWNYMCPNKDNISRTQCFKCQRYGHSTERCPDHWRQFDRISTFEQTPYNEKNETEKPVYCYQCAQKGHYGHNCPDFHRKYFIRDYHQLDTYPVYFFAASSPFIKYSVQFNETDKRIVNHLVEKPIDNRFSNKSAEEDPLEQLEKYQAKLRSGNSPNLSIFDETHANMPLKEYIRKWSNWVLDFHWIFTLKYFIEFLPTNKLHFFIKNYPSLDNFILHWMWWSYSLNKDLERFTKDPFRAIGSMPWLTYDVCDRDIDKNEMKETEMKAKQANKISSPSTKEINNIATKGKVKTQPSKFFQYNEFTIKTIGSLLFQDENSKSKFEDSSSSKVNKNLSRSVSYSNGDDIQEPLHTSHHTSYVTNQTSLNFKETCNYLKSQMTEMTAKIENLNLSPESLNQNRVRSKSMSSQMFTNDLKSHTVDNNEPVEEDNVFKDDELDKTIVYFEMGFSDKDEIEASQKEQDKCSIKSSVFLNKYDFKLETNQLQEYINNQLKIEIDNFDKKETDFKQLGNSEQQDQPSVFDKFFKSFSDQEENKKQNEDNLSRIFDLLNKTTVVKKTESLLTTTTIIPTTDDEPVSSKNENIDNNIVESVSEPVNEDSSNLIKILLKIDTPTSSPTCSSTASSTPEIEKKTLNIKSDLKCPNNSKSSERLSVFSSSSSSLTSSKSSNGSSFNSPLMSRTSKSLDENKSLSATKENLISTSSKSSPCISSMKSHNKNKCLTENNFKQKSPINFNNNNSNNNNKNRKQMNDKRFNNQQKFNMNSNQYRSFSSSNVNRIKETENNNIIRNKFKNVDDLSKEKCLMNQNYSSNLIPNYRLSYQLPHQQQQHQQQIHHVPINYGYDFSRPWPISLNNQDQNNHYQQPSCINFENMVNNRRYFPPYIFTNNAQYHQKPIINNNLYKQQWPEKQTKETSSDSLSTIDLNLNFNSNIQMTNYVRNNYNLFNKTQLQQQQQQQQQHQRNMNNQYIKEQNIISFNNMNQNKLNADNNNKQKLYQQNFNNYQGNTKENMVDGSINRTQMNLNSNFNRTNPQFKNNEFIQSSSSSPPSTSLALHSYMNNAPFNMMPLNNIINQSPKSQQQNQIKSNHMNNQYSKQNNFNRNRFNSQKINNSKNEENKQLFTNNYNKLQNQRTINIISNQQNRQMVHSSTYNVFGSNFNDSNKITTSSSYSETLGVSNGGFNQQMPIQYSVNPSTENMINYNRNNIKKSKDQTFNNSGYNNATNSITNNITSQSKQLFVNTLASNNNLNGQKRQKAFYSKKPI